MEPRLQKRIQRYGWDRASDDYARYWRSQLEPGQTRLLELADLHAGEKVLVVAWGDDLGSVWAAEAGVTEPGVHWPRQRRFDLLERLLGSRAPSWPTALAPGGPGLYFLAQG